MLSGALNSGAKVPEVGSRHSANGSVPVGSVPQAVSRTGRALYGLVVSTNCVGCRGLWRRHRESVQRWVTRAANPRCRSSECSKCMAALLALPTPVLTEDVPWISPREVV